MLAYQFGANVMRYALSDNEWSAIRLMLPNKPRGVAFCGYHRQRSRRTDLPEPGAGRTQPALGRRHHLHRIAVGFVYLAAILDAWSRRVVGYAIGRRVDARLALAAHRAAIATPQPPKDCIHHSDRGSQYTAEDHRAEFEKHGLKGSMGRRGNPYDNAKAESFMKTLKVEEVYLMEYDTFQHVTTASGFTLRGCTPIGVEELTTL